MRLSNICSRFLHILKNMYLTKIASRFKHQFKKKKKSHTNITAPNIINYITTFIVIKIKLV